jgi:hypothetical protein
MAFPDTFIAGAVREWITALGAKTAYIMPGSPSEKGYCESFNTRPGQSGSGWSDVRRLSAKHCRKYRAVRRRPVRKALIASGPRPKMWASLLPNIDACSVTPLREIAMVSSDQAAWLAAA